MDTELFKLIEEAGFEDTYRQILTSSESATSQDGLCDPGCSSGSSGNQCSSSVLPLLIHNLQVHNSSESATTSQISQYDLGCSSRNVGSQCPTSGSITGSNNLQKVTYLVCNDPEPTSSYTLAISCLKGSTDNSINIIQQHNESSDTDTEEKRYNCDICSFRTAYKGCLMNHKLTHKDETPYICDKCFFRTAVKYRLTKHIKTHTEEKPYSCDKCFFRTAYKCNLTEHMFKHKEEKPYICDKCYFRTASKQRLRRHMKTHTDE